MRYLALAVLAAACTPLAPDTQRMTPMDATLECMGEVNLIPSSGAVFPTASNLDESLAEVRREIAMTPAQEAMIRTCAEAKMAG